MFYNIKNDGWKRPARRLEPYAAGGECGAAVFEANNCRRRVDGAPRDEKTGRFPAAAASREQKDDVFQSPQVRGNKKTMFFGCRSFAGRKKQRLSAAAALRDEKNGVFPVAAWRDEKNAIRVACAALREASGMAGGRRTAPSGTSANTKVAPTAQFYAAVWRIVY